MSAINGKNLYNNGVTMAEGTLIKSLTNGVEVSRSLKSLKKTSPIRDQVLCVICYLYLKCEVEKQDLFKVPKLFRDFRPPTAVAPSRIRLAFSLPLVLRKSINFDINE